MNSDQSNPELVSAPNLGYKIKMHEVKTYGQRGAPALVEDFHPNALMQLHTSRTENRSECFDYASVVANNLADVFRMNSQFEQSHRLALDLVNLYLFGMVHDARRVIGLGRRHCCRATNN